MASRNSEDSSESEAESMDSDEELQEAFSKGELGDGLNVNIPITRTYANNTAGMKSKLEESLLKLEWVERLDLTTHLETIADNVLVGKEKIEPQYKVETPGDQIVDDLLRETLFYRQAQAAIIEGLSRLKAMNIPTKRPEDYFAQMAKSDDHMLKVKRRVLAQQLSQEKSQKVKKLRELKKYGKKVQVEVGLQRAKEKKEMLSKVKQYREGKLASLDFLDEKMGKKKDFLEETKQKTKEKNVDRQITKTSKGKLKRQEKDKKFGFGGKKSGSKKNNLKKTEARGGKAKAGRPGKNKRAATKGKSGNKR